MEQASPKPGTAEMRITPARNWPERLVITVGAAISLACVVLLVILLLS